MKKSIAQWWKKTVYFTTIKSFWFFSMELCDIFYLYLWNDVYINYGTSIWDSFTPSSLASHSQIHHHHLCITSFRAYNSFRFILKRNKWRWENLHAILYYFFFELKKYLEIKLVQLQIANLLELKKSILSLSIIKSVNFHRINSSTGINPLKL